MSKRCWDDPLYDEGSFRVRPKITLITQCFTQCYSDFFSVLRTERPSLSDETAENGSSKEIRTPASKCQGQVALAKPILRAWCGGKFCEDPAGASQDDVIQALGLAR